jgi:hypothetical protein
MDGLKNITISPLGADNWSVFKVKFQAFLECKGLWAAIKEPESAEGKNTSVEAREYLILYTQDAFVKLIVGEDTTAQERGT